MLLCLGGRRRGIEPSPRNAAPLLIPHRHKKRKKRRKMAARWSSESVVAEHRELQVLACRGGVQGAAAGGGRAAARAGMADSTGRGERRRVLGSLVWPFQRHFTVYSCWLFQWLLCGCASLPSSPQRFPGFSSFVLGSFSGSWGMALFFLVHIFILFNSSFYTTVLRLVRHFGFAWSG